MGTEHEGLFGDWAWRCIRELWPDEITPGGVSQQYSIRNEWTTFTKLNDWYTCNKNTLIDSGLAIDNRMTLSDGTIADITMREDKLRQIINFDENKATEEKAKKQKNNDTQNKRLLDAQVVK